MENGIRTIITTGPPHSVHLIGYRLKKKNPSLRWLADFRDPWSEWGLLDSLKVSAPVRALHRKLEAKVLQHADKIITITPFYVRKFEALAQRKVVLLTNGFDDDDFKTLTIQPTEKFVIRHVGIVNEKCNPKPFMTAIQNLMKADPQFRSNLQIDFVGEVHSNFKDFVLSNADLSSVTTFTPSVPHDQLIALYGRSSLLLLILTGYKDAEGYMPGKLFEYLATGLPVIGTGPTEGDSAKLLASSGAGEMIDADDQERIKLKVTQYFSAWNSGTLKIQIEGVQKYSRKNITKELTELFR
jgi:glycosyltransferase involved in cell wall biosynthesis